MLTRDMQAASLAILAFICWTNASILWTGRTTPANRIPEAQNSAEAPSGWRKIDADGKLSFYVPPSMRDTGSSGMENYHREYTTGRMYLTLDYEPYGHLAYENRARKFGKDFQEIELLVDGRKSFLFVYQDKDRKNRRTYNAALYIGDLPNSEVLVQMLASSRSPRVVEIAKTIFRTIKFPPSSEKKS